MGPVLRLTSATLLLLALMSLPVPIAGAVEPVVVAAGDVACADSPCEPEQQTAALIESIDPEAVLVLGDAQYPDGEYEDFLSSYHLTWGRFLAKTYPTPGNHEYNTDGASGYFQYFGRRAHEDRGGTYVFNIGEWHVVSINTGHGPPEASVLERIRRNLAWDRHQCELAFWHHPAFSSGSEYGSIERMHELWATLQQAGVDVALTGHEHSYERFARLDEVGRPNARTGMRQFVVGTGGAKLYQMEAGILGSQRRIDDRHGVLYLRLRPRSYVWRFVGVDGSTLDSGRTECRS
jgi:acid phosphatase type 7